MIPLIHGQQGFQEPLKDMFPMEPKLKEKKNAVSAVQPTSFTKKDALNVLTVAMPSADKDCLYLQITIKESRFINFETVFFSYEIILSMLISISPISSMALIREQDENIFRSCTFISLTKIFPSSNSFCLLVPLSREPDGVYQLLLS